MQGFHWAGLCVGGLMLALTACEREPEVRRLDPPVPADVQVQVVLNQPEHAVTVATGSATTGATDTNQTEEGWTGGARWRVFVYEAQDAGEQSLTFEEVREWEPDSVLSTQRVAVTVTPESASPASAEGR